MEMARPRLRPMNLGDLIDEAIALYRRNFALFAGIAVVLVIPEAIINSLLALSRGSALVTTDASGHAVYHSGQLAGYLGSTFSATFVQFFFTALLTGALAHAFSSRYLGRQTTVVGTYSAIGLATFIILAVATFFGSVLSFIGLFFLIVPGVICFTRFLFIPQSVVLERKGILGSMGRSWELVSGSFWRVLGIAIVIYIIVVVISAVVGGIAGVVLAAAGERTGVGATIIGAIIQVLITPFELGAFTLLYYDLRIRKEGFDLEYMARTLDASTGV